MKTTRKYTMGARAQAVDATRRRIVDALIALAGERPFAEVTLDTIAERAAVSVQTVLRQFGSRDGLFAEAMDAAMVDAEDERRTPPGDVAAAVRIDRGHSRTVTERRMHQLVDGVLATGLAAGRKEH